MVLFGELALLNEADKEQKIYFNTYKLTEMRRTATYDNWAA